MIFKNIKTIKIIDVGLKNIIYIILPSVDRQNSEVKNNKNKYLIHNNNKKKIKLRT